MCWSDPSQEHRAQQHKWVHTYPAITHPALDVTILYVCKKLSVIPAEVIVYIIVFCQNVTTPYTGGILVKTIIFLKTLKL